MICHDMAISKLSYVIYVVMHVGGKTPMPHLTDLELTIYVHVSSLPDELTIRNPQNGFRDSKVCSKKKYNTREQRDKHKETNIHSLKPVLN